MGRYTHIAIENKTLTTVFTGYHITENLKNSFSDRMTNICSNTGTEGPEDEEPTSCVELAAQAADATFSVNNGSGNSSRTHRVTKLDIISNCFLEHGNEFTKTHRTFAATSSQADGSSLA